MVKRVPGSFRCLLSKGKASGACGLSSPRLAEVEAQQVEQLGPLLHERSTQLLLPGRSGLQKER